MIVEIDYIARHGNRLDKPDTCKVAFKTDSVISVRQIATIDPKVFHTKIVFCGDRYEHHAIETATPYREVLKMIHWHC